MNQLILFFSNTMRVPSGMQSSLQLTLTYLSLDFLWKAQNSCACSPPGSHIQNKAKGLWQGNTMICLMKYSHSEYITFFQTPVLGQIWPLIFSTLKRCAVNLKVFYIIFISKAYQCIPKHLDRCLWIEEKAGKYLVWGRSKEFGFQQSWCLIAALWPRTSYLAPLSFSVLIWRMVQEQSFLRGSLWLCIQRLFPVINKLSSTE